MALRNWLRKIFSKTAPVVKPATDTEFTAEVVRVTEVLTHPGADRLEIAKFELKGSGPASYEVVIGKGSLVVGSLAAYLSVDCSVPINHPSGVFKFLGERLDGKFKETYRLRAARLRGMFSQGLLVDTPVGAVFGDSVAAAYGVTYYERPVPGCPTQPGAPRVRARDVVPQYEINSLKKVPRLFEEGEQVLVTEKIHGCNMRFGWLPRTFLGLRIGWKFFVGSHRAVKGGGTAGYYEGDVWSDSATAMALARKTKKFPGYMFYGELFGHTFTGQRLQDLTYGRAPAAGPGLVCFDVWRTKGKAWLAQDEREDMLNAVGLAEVPVLFCGSYAAAKIATMAEGVSTIDGKTVREGVVVEAVDGARKKAKFVSQGYLLRKEAA